MRNHTSDQEYIPQDIMPFRIVHEDKALLAPIPKPAVKP